MKHLSKTALTLLLAVGASSSAYADAPLAGCAAKRDSISTELRLAREKGYADKVTGLQRALDEVNAHCRDDALSERRQQKLIQAQAKVSQTERSLRLAQEANKEPKKIAKLQGRLQKAQSDLAALQAKQP